VIGLALRIGCKSRFEGSGFTGQLNLLTLSFFSTQEFTLSGFEAFLDKKTERPGRELQSGLARCEDSFRLERQFGSDLRGHNVELNVVRTRFVEPIELAGRWCRPGS
jgi:hypothetical protein